jgi:hypothetical protein
MEATSKVARATACSAGLARLKGQFEQWRAGRCHGERIPVELWAGAVAAAREHGAYRVAAELHLDYVVLKRRAAGSDGAPGTAAVPHFVELFAPTTAAPLGPPCVVEMVNARGGKMRVELSGAALPGLAALCQSFWGAR